MSATLRSLDGQDEATILREIQSALRGLRFGAVEITVHNGQVVQIERKENSVCSNRPSSRPEAHDPTGPPEASRHEHPFDTPSAPVLQLSAANARLTPRVPVVLPTPH